MTDFMKGYTRDAKMTETIIADLRSAIYANPDMRVGQLIDNALGPVIGYNTDLFNVYDETFLEALRRFGARA
jgi:hypothetical protein